MKNNVLALFAFVPGLIMAGGLRWRRQKNVK